MEYVGGKREGGYRDGCLFCQIGARELDDAESGVIARSEFSFAVLNRYPYTYGHTIIVPLEHAASPEDLSVAALTELAVMTNQVMRVLRAIADPPAFNLGANVGAAAGAGIAAHYHFHIVPRWPGDANFMVTIGETQTVPDTLANIHGRMKSAWQELFASRADSAGEHT